MELLVLTICLGTAAGSLFLVAIVFHPVVQAQQLLLAAERQLEESNEHLHQANEQLRNANAQLMATNVHLREMFKTPPPC